MATASSQPEPRTAASPYAGLATLTGLFACIFAIAMVLYVAKSTGIVDPSGHAVGRDFINLYTAARLVGEGRAQTVFDVAAFHGVQKEILGLDEFPLHLWSYPPHFLFFVAWLGVFGYWPALALWSVMTAGLYAWAAGAPRTTSMLLLALAPATLVNLLCGQTGAIAGALFFGGLRTMHTRPVVAGAIFGLLTIKPQFGLLLPVMLLLERRWLVIMSAVATTAGLVGLSAAVFGPELWQAYLRENFVVTRGYLERGEGLFMLMAPSPFMAMRLFHAPLWLAYVVQLVCAALVAVGLVLAWRSRGTLENKIALTGVAALLTTPYAHNYDMTLVCVGVLAGCVAARAAAERALLLLVWLLPVAMVPLHAIGLVIAPWLLLGFYYWLLRHTRHDATDAAGIGQRTRNDES